MIWLNVVVFVIICCQFVDSINVIHSMDGSRGIAKLSRFIVGLFSLFDIAKCAFKSQKQTFYLLYKYKNTVLCSQILQFLSLSLFEIIEHCCCSEFCCCCYHLYTFWYVDVSFNSTVYRIKDFWIGCLEYIHKKDFLLFYKTRFVNDFFTTTIYLSQ